MNDILKKYKDEFVRKKVKLKAIDKLSEMIKKIKNLRKDTMYVFFEVPEIVKTYNYVTMQKQIDMLQQIALTQRHLGIDVYPALIVRKREVKKT